MKLFELLDGIEYEPHCDTQVEIRGICNDSRKAQDGFAFVAVGGYSDDGLKYAPAALDAGAACVVCDRTPTDASIPHVLVGDAREALSHISANFYRHPTRSMKIVGVTGTNGKTTTTHLIRHIIEKCLGAPCGLVGGNGISFGTAAYPAARTTPEAHELQEFFAQMLERGITHAVMEVSSHALCLERVRDIDFEVGAFTNLTQDHLDFHRTLDAYFEAKMRLLRAARHCVVNYDDPRGSEAAAQNVNTTTFSTTSDYATFVAKNIRLFADRIEFELLHKGLCRVILPIPGKFSVQNALTAIAVCDALGIPPSDAAAALRDCPPVVGRMESLPLPTHCGYSVIIDYACTPDALEQALLSLKSATDGRLICLFGCGGDRDRGKRPLMGAIAEQIADFVYVTSDNPRTEVPEDIISDIVSGMKKEKKRDVITDRRAAIHAALASAERGDIILLAGKGQETYQEIHGIKHHMDEREIVAEFYEVGEK